MLDEEQENLVKKFIFLPLVRKVLELDKEKIKKAGFKFEETYLNIVERAITKVTSDLRDTKLAMKKIGMTVYDNGKDDTGTYRYLVVHKGYQREIGFLPNVIKVNVRECMDIYLAPLWLN